MMMNSVIDPYLVPITTLLNRPMHCVLSVMQYGILFRIILFEVIYHIYVRDFV